MTKLNTSLIPKILALGQSAATRCVRWSTDVFLISHVSVLTIIFLSSFVDVAIAQDVEIREPNDDALVSYLWEDYSSGNPDRIDFAKSFAVSSDFSDRVNATWASFLYDDWSRNAEARKELLGSIDREIIAHFQNRPTWWSKTFLSCKPELGRCVGFSVDNSTAVEGLETAERVTIDEIEYLQVKPIRGAMIRIRVTDFTLSSPVENIAVAVQYSPIGWPQRVFVCPYQQTSQVLRLWSFSATARLQWMQAIDFHNSESAMNERCGSSVNGRVTLAVTRDEDESGGIRSQNVALFGAWSNNVLVTEFCGEDGRALNCFNTLQYREL